MKNLKQGTLQELCDMAVKAIVKQGGQCLNSWEECVPVSECGTMKCAFSHCVDGRTRVGLEYHADPLGGLADWVTGFELSAEEREVFRQLQFFHDHTSKRVRLQDAVNLTHLGIETTGKHWQQWIEMGE